MPVLALERPDLEQLGAQWGRDGHLERDALDVRERLHRAPDVRRGAQEAPGLLLLAERVVCEQRRGLVAEQDLARLGRGLHLHRPTGSRPDDEELAMRLAHEEELEAPEWRPACIFS